MINVLGLITVLHQSVSHMTGNISMLAMALVNWEPQHIVYLFLVTLCYVIGSMYSGLILGNSHFQLGRLYGYPLSLVALFILLSWILLLIFLAMACSGPVQQWAYKMPWSAIIRAQLFAPRIYLAY